MAEQDKKEINKGMNKKKLSAAVLGLLAVVYIGGAVYFNHRYLPGTTMNGDKIGGKTVAQVEAMIETKQDEYQVTLKGRDDYSEVISGSDIGYDASYGASLKDGLEKQSGFLWFMGAPKDTKELAADVTFDEKKLQNVVDSLACMKKKNNRKPVNATIKMDKNGKFKVVKEDIGTTVVKKNITKSVKKALSVMDGTVDMDQAKCYKNPAIYKDDEVLQKSIKQAEKICKVTITYDFKYTTEEVTPEMIKKWIKFDINTSKPELDYDQVLAYIEGLAHKYDTFSSVRTIKDQGGREHKVYYGDYGWKISQTKEAKKLMKVILKGKSVTREPIYMYKAVCRKEGNIDWDDTYCLVNLSAQTMSYVKDGKTVLSSSVVTGDVNKGRGTPTGTYEIMYKVTDTELVGANYSSHVNYFMVFAPNVGFHDATWRRSFGGSIFRGNGSHGCVNMPLGNASALYKVLEPGTPVFVYY